MTRWVSLAHSLTVRVYYEDTDAAGIVYHARYLAFAERARTEAMRLTGATHDELATQHGLILVVRRTEMDYLRPARLDDLVVIATEVLEVRGASMTVRQDFTVDGQKVGALRVGLACVRRVDSRPARLPERWRAVWAGAGHEQGHGQRQGQE